MRADVIYLDHAATTPLDPRALDAMLPYLRDQFGNPASRHHAPGQRAKQAVDAARAQVAEALGADPREIFWTSGATESDNLALKGVASSPAYEKKRHLVTVRTEHKAVLDPARELETRGFDVTWLGVDAHGRLSLDELAAALRDDTLLVSVMHANNEIGVIHPIEEIGALCRERRVLFHTDATQSFGKLPLDVNAANVDLLSLSAHKIYGPKGVGALYVRRRRPRVRCEPLFTGGGHERGLRSGTLNVPGIVGLAKAAELCLDERAPEATRLAALRDRLLSEIRSTFPDVRVNGEKAPRLPHLLNFSVPGIDAESLLGRIPTLALSTAAACTSSALQPSYVLAALGLEPPLVDASLRISLGRSSTDAQVAEAAEVLIAALTTEREEGPRTSCRPL